MGQLSYLIEPVLLLSAVLGSAVWLHKRDMKAIDVGERQARAAARDPRGATREARP